MGTQEDDAAKSWDEDAEFCAWLIHMNYAEQTDKGINCKLTIGLRCYMRETWQAAKGRPVAGWERKTSPAPLDAD